MKTKISVVVTIFAIVVSLFAGCSFGVNFDLSPYKYADPDSYSEYSGPLELNASDDRLDYLGVEWINGNVEISSGHLFTVYEENTEGEYLPLYWKFDGETLIIKYAENGTPNGKISNSKKKLVVVLPCPVGEVDLDLVNSDHCVSLSNAGKLNVDFVNGTGKYDFGIISEAAFDSVNGGISMKVRDTSATGNISINTVNGDSVIFFPDETRLKVGFSSLNGKLTNELTETESGTDVVKISADTLNGNLAIKKYVPESQGFLS